MKAAETESKLLSDTDTATIIGNTEKSSTTDSLPNIPGVDSNQEVETTPFNIDQVKDALKNTNISTMMNQMAANPETVTKMMEESMSRMTPDMMEKARKMAMGGQGEHIMKEMQKRGMDPHAMRAQVLEQQRMLRGLTKSSTATKQAILITKSRQIKTRQIALDSGSIQMSAAAILKAASPVDLSCSRLARGPLAGKTIKAWYDPEQGGVNRRAKKIVGFPVGGEILIVMEEGSISEKDFLTVEKQLE